MKRTLLIISAVLAVISAGGRQLSPDEALARVHVPSVSSASVAKAAVYQPSLVYTVEHQARPRAYVLNTGQQGYLVVSADDCAPALLGYSDNGTFDLNDIPENMRAWLDGYASQIAWAADRAEGRSVAAPAVKQRAEVAPKITTRWNQDNPYWLKCPRIGSRYCYTGCVATALAQIMNWHKWPEQPTGEVTYTCRGIGTLSLDYSTVKFEWDKMLDSYTPSSPAENKEAVATLMQACGYGAHMYYSTEGSGASSYIAGMTLINNFGYDKALSLQLRRWYDMEAWEDLVYDELTTNGPVYYDGSGTGGGHAFVCDGYSAADGMFHFNWGWSGMSDGYFRLTALNPGEQGAGGVSPGYNWDQSIMRGLRKARPDSEYTYVFAPYMGVRSPMTESEYVELGKFFTLLGYDTQDGFCNYSLTDLTGVTFGAQFKNTLTGAVRYLVSDNLVAISMAAYTRRQIIRVPLPTDLAEGNYEIRPVYRVGAEGSWSTMMEDPMCVNYIAARVEGNKVYMSTPLPAARISVGRFETPEYFTSGSPFTIKALAKNEGTSDFVGELRAAFMSYDEAAKKLDVAAQGAICEVVIPAGDSVKIDYTSSIVKGELSDGEYYLCFGNTDTGEIVSDLYPVKVGNRYGQLRMSYYDFAIDSSNFVDRDKMKISAQVTCQEGTYNGPVIMAISSSRRNFKIEWELVSSANYDFTAVEAKTIEFNTAFPQGELGMNYYAILGYRAADGSCVLMAENPISFTVGECSGIDIAAVDSTLVIYYDAVTGQVSASGPADVTSLRVVSVNGAVVVETPGERVDVSALPAGVYMVVATDVKGNTVTSKIVK